MNLSFVQVSTPNPAGFSVFLLIKSSIYLFFLITNLFSTTRAMRATMKSLWLAILASGAGAPVAAMRVHDPGDVIPVSDWAGDNALFADSAVPVGASQPREIKANIDDILVLVQLADLCRLITRSITPMSLPQAACLYRERTTRRSFSRGTAPGSTSPMSRFRNWGIAAVRRTPTHTASMLRSIL